MGEHVNTLIHCRVAWPLGHVLFIARPKGRGTQLVFNIMQDTRRIPIPMNRDENEDMIFWQEN